MACALLSQDFLMICFLVARGDLDLNAAELILRVETFQNTGKRYFGISEHDFRNALYKLIFSHASLDELEEKVRSEKLRDLVPIILDHHELYLNDEGEHWITSKAQGEKNLQDWQINCWYGCDREDYQKRKELLKKLKVLFTVDNIPAITEDVIKRFMAENDITDAYLNQNGVFYSCE